MLRVEILSRTSHSKLEFYSNNDFNLLFFIHTGETLTQALYLFSDWASEEDREVLWTKKRGLFAKVDYVVPDAAMASAGLSKTENKIITVQKG